MFYTRPANLICSCSAQVHSSAMFVLELHAMMKELKNVDFSTEQMNFLRMRRFCSGRSWISSVPVSVRLFIWCKNSEMLHGFGNVLFPDALLCNSWQLKSSLCQDGCKHFQCPLEGKCEAKPCSSFYELIAMGFRNDFSLCHPAHLLAWVCSGFSLELGKWTQKCKLTFKETVSGGQRITHPWKVTAQGPNSAWESTCHTQA